MLSKVDKISDFCDKMLVVDYIILISFSAVMICVPTFMTFFCMSDKDRGWIASIVGGVLSLIVIPLLINHINRKQKKRTNYLKLISIYIKS